MWSHSRRWFPGSLPLITKTMQDGSMYTKRGKPARTLVREFEENGHWVIPKTSNRFSCIPIDQAHEQNDETVKGSGGAVGLTENPLAFRKWMVNGPEQAHLIKEFEEEYISKPTPEHQHICFTIRRDSRPRSPSSNKQRV